MEKYVCWLELAEWSEVEGRLPGGGERVIIHEDMDGAAWTEHLLCMVR
jgi:hypothetical protein